MPPASVFLLRSVLAIWALLWFHMKFKVVFPSFVKKVNSSLTGIALNLLVALGSVTILTVSILPNHKYGMIFTSLYQL